jgi:dolichol kinase
MPRTKMDAFTAEDRLLRRNHRARLRDQLSAWGRVSEPAAPLWTDSTGINSTGIKSPEFPDHDANGWSSTSDERIPSRELSRKLWHILPGYLILGVPVVRSFEPFHSHLCLVIVVLTMALSALSLIYARCFRRPGERDWRISVCAFAATGLLPLLAFPGHCELALTALVILSLGDGAAALGGQWLHGPKLPWNSKKTVAGMLSFFCCAAPAAAWVYWANADSGGTFLVALICALVASATAAVAESVPSPINDNVRVGVTGTLSLLLTHWCCS